MAALAKLLKLLVVLALVLGVAAGGFLYWAYREVHAPYRGYGDDEIFFTVERGASAREVGGALEAAGVVEDGRLFLAALQVRGDTARIKAGEYRFHEASSTLEVLDRLVAGDVYTFAVNVPEGLTLEETAEHLAKQGLGEAASLASAFRNGSLIHDLDPDADTLEGYLFPTTYHFGRGVSAEVVAQSMVAQFEAVFDGGRQSGAAHVGLSNREVVTLASIIEKETGKAEERPLIGSVFWNRLRRGMALGSDPTIIYALKLEGKFDGNLRRADLELDSPYNTYRAPGLPPGPIASPGEAAIDAVLQPDETDYLYFVSKNDGSHYFSKTYREHLNAVRKYQVEYFRRQRQKERNGAGS